MLSEERLDEEALEEFERFRDELWKKKGRKEHGL